MSWKDIWNEIKRLNKIVNEPQKELKEHMFAPGQGVWDRVKVLEERCAGLEAENESLKARISTLEKEIKQVEPMLIKAVNKHLESV